MFRASTNYKYDKLDTSGEQRYKITHGDILHLTLYSNGGYQLLDAIGQGSVTSAGQTQYRVKDNGFVSLPMIDSVEIQGKSIEEAEKMLSNLYSYYFVKPFVLLTVINMRVIVFTGSAHAQVITLENNSITLAEVLANAGGIPQGSRAYDIKIIRPGLNGQIKIEKVDLSKISSIPQSQMRIFPNDVVYVTPGAELNTAIGEITPLIGIFLTALSLIAIFNHGNL